VRYGINAFNDQRIIWKTNSIGLKTGRLILVILDLVGCRRIIPQQLAVLDTILAFV